MFWLLLPLIVMVSWVSVGELSQNSAVLKRTTEEMMRANDGLIQAYARKYGEVPPSLNELRLYAKLRGRSYAGVDSWGGRFEYLRLGRVNYTIRSFGEDGVQNSEATDPDPGIFRWGQMVQTGLQYDYDAAQHQARPSVLLFAGADNAQRGWHAKLFLDSATGARRLLVRNKKILNLYMLAPHDGIEEFIWLPDGQRVVFTASGSARYGDGVWIWDLKTDHAWNLLELGKGSSDLSPAKQAKGLYLALANVTKEENPKLRVYIAPASIAVMKASWFFHPQNLHSFSLLGGEKFEHTPPIEGLEKEPSLFDYEWMGQSTVASGGHGAAMQRSWLRLPRGGNWEDAMGVWQEYAATHSQSPLAAYAIWSLALFYRDAEQGLANSSREAAIARGYSIELSLALSQMISAPGWMRAVARSSLR